jgi:hypothetical protein
MSGNLGQISGTREFSQQGYKRGNLKRRLPTVTVALVQNDNALGEVSSGTVKFRHVLKNIFGGLSINLSVGLVGLDVTTPVEAAAMPAGAITWQGTPVNVFGDAPPMFLRPIFQDPTATDNGNHPLPQDAPFGWEFETVGDDLYIDITVNATLLVGMNIKGRLVIQAAVEYTGSWPFPEAVVYQLNMVQLTGGNSGIIFNTFAS